VLAGLINPTGEKAWVLFTLLDADGKPVPVPGNELGAIVKRTLNRITLNPLVRAAFGRMPSGPLFAPHIQVQCLVDGQASSEEVAELSELMLQISRRLRPRTDPVR